MYGEVLRCRDCAEVAWVITLQPTHEIASQRRSEERIFAIGFLSATPARIAEDVDIRRPDGQPEIDTVNPFANRLVVLGAGLRRNDRSDALKQAGIPRGGHPDRLRKEGRIARARYPMQTFAPVVISGNAQVWDGWCGINTLGRRSSWRAVAARRSGSRGGALS